GTGDMWPDNLGCVGSERHPGECPTAVLGEPDCVPGHAAAVTCSGLYGTCSRHVRLAGGPGRCAGRVEVYVQGSWATVCEDTWDMSAAGVVCRQLGCGTALAAPDSARFGASMMPPWLVAVGCAGTEASLWDCPARAQGGCRRGGGAGAVCSGQCRVSLGRGPSRGSLAP
ncbi:C163A protein, partial [Ceuthmochares aereus]|nr:C163A protein [Ceuthmochares aereus]